MRKRLEIQKYIKKIEQDLGSLDHCLRKQRKKEKYREKIKNKEMIYDKLQTALMEI